MPPRRPLRFVGPVLLALCLGIVLTLGPGESTPALLQVGLVTAGSALVTVAAYRNPLSTAVGWRPLLSVGEVAIGVGVPLGVLGTGLNVGTGHHYGPVAAVAGLGLLVVIGSQVLLHRS